MAEVRRSDRLEAFEQAIRFWARDTRAQLRQRLVALGLDERRTAQRGASRLRIQRLSKVTTAAKLVKEEYLIESLRYSLRRRGLEIEAISFSFARHGIFLEVGVGKNRKRGSGKENPKVWINHVLPSQVEDLAGIIGDGYADIISGEIAIDIPGVYSTTISV